MPGRKPNTKKKTKNSGEFGWVAGGHAPKGKVSPELAKSVKKYLHEQEKRKKSK
jgi:hypothetical protein